MQKYWNCQAGLPGECIVAPNVLPHQWHDECMRELHQELSKHKARAGLQGEPVLARSTAECRRCSCNHSASWACSPSARPQVAESTKWSREDPSAGWSVLRRWYSCSRGRDSPSQHQPPSLAPNDPAWLKGSSATPWKISTYKWDPVDPGSGSSEIMPPTPTEEKPWRKKQVRFDVDEELGNDHTLPEGLTLFLAEGMAEKWDDASSPYSPLSMDFPWLPPSEDPQCSLTYAGGARPNIPTKPFTGQSWSQPQSRPKEALDQVNHPSTWIHAKMERPGHPHWWDKIKVSRRVSMGSWIIREGLSNSKALHYAQWQTVALSLPLAQHKALAGGMPHPGSVGSVPRISCSPLMSPALGISGLWGRRRP